MTEFEHDHTFGQDARRPGESRTAIVVALTSITMVVEIAAGLAFGSMALLADGLHMASHAVALGINLYAYVYGRRHAGDPRFSFGTGKVNALGGHSGAILLAMFAALMGWESAQRLFQPTAITFDQAILVAVLGLVVNGASLFLLGDKAGDDRREAHHRHRHDHNLRSAYLHVLADALTSLLAIVALLSAKYFGQIWMDPAMGIVGAILVARWSFGLLRSASVVLLDHQASVDLQAAIRSGIEKEGDSRVADLHIWAIGPDIYAVVLTIVTREPRSPGEYKAMLPKGMGLAHVTIEVSRRGL